jgi:hypothetical protein
VGVLNVYLIKFSGYFLDGKMIVIDETKRKALYQAKKKLDESGLLDKNEDLTLDDVQEIPTDKRSLLLINDGDY